MSVSLAGELGLTWEEKMGARRGDSARAFFGEGSGGKDFPATRSEKETRKEEGCREEVPRVCTLEVCHLKNEQGKGGRVVGQGSKVYLRSNLYHFPASSGFEVFVVREYILYGGPL